MSGVIFRPAVDTIVTKWPRPCETNTGMAAAIPFSTPRRFTSIIEDQPARSASAVGPMTLMPALATNTSRRPNSDTAVETRRCRSSGLVTSIVAVATSAPPPRSSAAMRSSRSVRRAPSTTAAPRAASTRAVASPMPLLAPVMAMTVLVM
jgi:hypothetical protein